jgi:Zn finger protein HypA/HybF involved in hydrogenase expression
MESFKLKMPTCPECGSRETKIDIGDYSNLVRIPAAAGSAALIGIPLASMSFLCQNCKTRFKDTGEE